MAERIFRFVSLCFLTVGAVVGIAGADKDADKSVTAVSELIQEVKSVQEVNKVNSQTNINQLPPLVSATETVIVQPSQAKKALPR